MKQPEVFPNNGTNTLEEETSQNQKKNGDYMVEITRNSDDNKVKQSFEGHLSRNSLNENVVLSTPHNVHLD